MSALIGLVVKSETDLASAGRDKVAARARIGLSVGGIGGEVFPRIWLLLGGIGGEVVPSTSRMGTLFQLLPVPSRGRLMRRNTMQ